MSKTVSKSEKLETEKAEAKKKVCFIITPLGAGGSDIRRKADGLIDTVLRPVLTELDYYVIPPHEILTPGSITVQIIKYLLNADMVIANLTGLNPNVMYELAVRHASRKPVVCLVENGTNLPFDIAAERTIFYSDDMAGVTALIPYFKNTVESAELDEEPDNPIYRGVQDSLIRESNQTTDVQTLILNRLDDIEAKISRQSASPLSESSNIPRLNPNPEWTIIDIAIQEERSFEEITEIVKAIAEPKCKLVGIRASSKPKIYYVTVQADTAVSVLQYRKRLRDAGLTLGSI